MSVIPQIVRSFLPTTRPQIEAARLIELASSAQIDLKKELCVIGIRGYFNQGNNQRGIYDDAIFVVGPFGVKAFNANVDPGAFRKGIANLAVGAWQYKLGIHGLSKPKFLQYEALVQAAPVMVIRDQSITEIGYFGINIHKGGYYSVSSIGCQTIHPKQWDEFINTVRNSLKSLNQKQLTYILRSVE